jgi:hypothetical protein
VAEREDRERAVELFQRAVAEGDVDYVSEGELIALVPSEQLDRWTKIVANGAALDLVDEQLEADTESHEVEEPVKEVVARYGIETAEQEGAYVPPVSGPPPHPVLPGLEGAEGRRG